MSRCKFSCDVSSGTFDDMDTDRWECPHPTYNSSKWCIFHVLIHETREIECNKINNCIIESIESEEDKLNRFIGARLPCLRLNQVLLEGPSRAAIDFRGSMVHGPCDFTDTEIRNSILCDGSIFKEECLFENTVFQSKSSFRRCRFNSKTKFRLASFNSWADFKCVEFCGDANFRMASFRNGIYAAETVFFQSADFISAEFDQVANFYNSTFHQGAIFSSARFNGDAKFTKCTLKGPTKVFSNHERKPSFTERKEGYSKGYFDNTCLYLSSVRCLGDLQLDETDITSNVNILDSDVSGDLEISINSNCSKDIIISIINVDSISGYIKCSNSVDYVLTGSVLKDVDLRFDRDGTDFARFTFDGVVFDGFDFGRYRDHFRDNNWNLFDGREASSSTKENSYLRAKNGAIQAGETTAAREFHFREMLNRGRTYLEKAGNVNLLGSEKGFFRSAAILVYFLWKWFVNFVFRFSCGYGERPGRVIYCSTFIIIVFSFLYSLYGVSFTTGSILEPVAFSFQSFNAVFLGRPSVETLTISILVSVQGFLGPFFIALFVFTITQSLSR